MNSKNLIAAVLGGLTSFLVGWLVYGLLLKSTMDGMTGTATNVFKSNAEMALASNLIILLLGNLVMAYLLTHIFTRWATISSASSGASAGALLMGLYTLGYNLIMYATTNIMQFPAVFIDVMASAVIWAVGGAVIGWWLGRSRI